MQRDYILRLIEQAGSILKALLRQLRQGSVTPERREADLRSAAGLGGLDLDLLRLSDLDGILAMVAPTGELEPSRTWLAAETLYLDAVAADIEGRADQALASYGKAAALFRAMAPTWVLPSGFPEASERVAEIEDRMTALA